MIKEKLSLLPDKPGCYLMKDKNGVIIYVGKAKNSILKMFFFFFVFFSYPRVKDKRERRKKVLPCSSNGKESSCNTGEPGPIPGSGRASGEGYGNLLHYSCLEKPMDRGAWWATICGTAKSQTLLSD